MHNGGHKKRAHPTCLEVEDDDVYRHPDVSYKQSSEAETATIPK